MLLCSKLPRSAITILPIILAHSKIGITPSEIVVQTKMNPRTVRYALKHLIEKELIKMTVSLHDVRFHQYSICKEKEKAVIQTYINPISIK